MNRMIGRRWWVVVSVALLALSLQPGIARAWKPLTHSYTGEQARADAVDGDGGITINGRIYAVNAQVNTAIAKWPAYYDAGVIGPDGFPDIAYGQAVIHPGDPAVVHPGDPASKGSTGRWLGYLLQQAWQAQGLSSYSADEKEQILAFTYGFLTHAAGDLWGHTLINDFAGGVFPSVKDVLTSLPAAKIALRHLVAEGYVGSATPGFDSPDADDAIDTGETCSPSDQAPPDTVCNVGSANEDTLELSRVCADPNKPPTPGTRCKVDGPFGSKVPDISADATPGIQFEVPTRFLQRTMIDLAVITPADDCDADGDGDPGCPNGTFSTSTPELTRGPVLDQILGQEAKLQILRAKYRFDATHTMCSTTLDPDCHDTTVTLSVATVRGTAKVNVPSTSCTAQVFCVDSPGDVADDVIDGLIADYVNAWIADISEMRDHWAEFSLGVTRGIFDPQTLRDAANDACQKEGAETITNNARNACEEGVGHLDASLFALDNFYASGDPSWINRYLIPASGLPDGIADLRGLLQKVGNAIDDVFTFLGIANPISQLTADVKKFVHDKINDFIQEQYGLDLEALQQFEKRPSQWMCGSDANNPISITLPAPIGTVSPGGIFSPAEHARIDQIMGLDADHHEAAPGLPLDCSPLADDAKFDPQDFAPLKNTVTTAKLLLLDGSTLNKVLGDVLANAGVIKDAALVATYHDPAGGPPANLMVDGLSDTSHVATPAASWLELIDGDHAWRQDGLPRFCDNDGSGHCTPLPPDLGAGANPTPRPLPSQLGGQKNGGNGQFPIWESCLLRPAFRELYDDWENGERTFSDLGDQPSPDASDPNPPTTTLTAGGSTFTSGGTTYIGADNQFTLSVDDTVFTNDNLGVRYRVFKHGTAPGSFASIDNGGSFAISGGDGLYHVQFQAEDPCHTFAAADTLPPGPVQTKDFVLDTTGPAITISSPAPEGVVFDTDDTSTIAYAADDAGGSGVASTSVTLDGKPATNGQLLDMFSLDPGVHTIVVDAVDNLGNTSTASRTFQVHATAQSLNSNIDRACALGLIKANLCNAFKAKTAAALAAHNRGQHKVEANILRALIHQLRAQRGKGVDPATADRLIAFIQDLIERGG